eukprot:gb/GEZN01014438.1/.p1 GENE.gb/GEZN01014438.1/~~gb/GEZN01014438.1/.p1  ORF type:complete len:241 (+),score=31.12 gb/GEZN01014438.1/:58-780(+)
MAEETKTIPEEPPVTMQLSIDAVLRRVMMKEPLLDSKHVKKRFKEAQRKTNKTGRGCFCLVYGSVEDAYNFKPAQQMVWKAVEHEMVKDLCEGGRITRLHTHDTKISYAVLVSVTQKDGSEFITKEMIVSPPLGQMSTTAAGPKTDRTEEQQTHTTTDKDTAVAASTPPPSSTISENKQENKKCSFSPCQNLEQGQLAFKVCSRCKLSKYCSAVCQKKDWKAGGHKATCIPTTILVTHTL